MILRLRKPEPDETEDPCKVRRVVGKCLHIRIKTRPPSSLMDCSQAIPAADDGLLKRSGTHERNPATCSAALRNRYIPSTHVTTPICCWFFTSPQLIAIVLHYHLSDVHVSTCTGSTIRPLQSNVSSSWEKKFSARKFSRQ